MPEDLQIVAKLTTDGSQAIQTVGSYKKELREASQNLLKMQDRFGEFSKEAIQSAKHVAALKDKIDDSRKLVDAFNPDRKFAAFGQSVQGVVGGFTALQGVMGLVGGESKDLEKTLLKVQSAMALTAGLDTLRESIQGFKTMANIIKTNVVGALKSVKTAVAATGIGLLVIAVGALVAYWDDIKGAITGVNNAQTKLLKESQEHVKAEKDKLAKMNSQDNVLRLQGKSEKQILQLKASQTQEVINRMVREIEVQKQTVKAQVDAEKRNKSILKGIIEFTTVPLQLLINGIAKVAAFFGKDWSFNIAESISSMVFDPEEVEKKGQETITELNNQLDELKNTKAGYQLQIIDIDKKAAEAQVKLESDKLDRIKALNKDMLESIRQQRAEDGLNKKVGLNAGTTSAVTKDGAAVGQVGNELGEEAKTPEQKQLDILEATFKRRMEMVKGHEELEAAVTKSYHDQKIALEKQTATAKLNIISNTLGKAADIIGKQTAAGKALAIAQAVINTWTGATEVLKAKSVLPEPAATISKAINFGATVLTGLNAVKQIIKTPVPGGGGSSASLSAPSAVSPIAPQAQNTTTSLDQNTINGIGNAAGNRAFVLERDIQNNRELVTRLNRAARL